MAAVASGIMLAFLVYNLVDFPPRIREIMAVHDAVTAFVCAAIWWAIRTDRVAESQAHGIATGMMVLIASNILLAMWLLREPYHAIYICVLLVGAGASMTSVRWGGISVAALWIATVPVLTSVASANESVRYLAMMAATTAVSIALIVLRARNLRVLEHFDTVERQQRLALNDALADLDAKVSQRTAELQAANAALQLEIEERARAEREARELSEKLLHAQRLESLGRLAGGVAHDFNNLLTVIQGNLHLTLEQLPTNGTHEPIHDAIGASERAAQLTKQLLAFGRKQVIERRVFDMGKLVEDLSRILQRALGDRVELQIHVNGSDLRVDGDPNQIEVVLMNLVVNARDAMPTGGVCSIHLERTILNDSAFVRLQVRDTGVGMDGTTRQRLFEPFFTTKRTGEGTGLGLSTVYGVVQQHGGSISVLSEEGQGATFDVFMPIATSLLHQPSASDTTRLQATGSETVLLVEDEAAVRRVGERFLRRHGYNVLVASSAAEALDLATLDITIDLLFTDVMMPGVSGFELADRLRDMRPSIKVMFVSGYTGDYLESLAGELPAGSVFVSKPYDPTRTARMIRELLDGAGAGPAHHLTP